ncbi:MULTISPECIES: hypothetical protein [unclassified Nostoc]|uniref:hypothetical protein n=1 Tax=unclassified Nostoc TaxID=2593658 RepID=UPI00260CF8C1|nr:hypothetical protein [Nostoc sp. S13]MDF5739015.1 hypothetical protein [Nostoc sp. S13]
MRAGFGRSNFCLPPVLCQRQIFTPTYLLIWVTEYELAQLRQQADNRRVSSSDVVAAWIAQLPPPRQKSTSD